jgi:hypothetical protein
MISLSLILTLNKLTVIINKQVKIVLMSNLSGDLYINHFAYINERFLIPLCSIRNDFIRD